MEEFKKAFMSYFNDNNKDMCVQLTIEALHKHTVTIQELYEDVLRIALNSINVINDKDEDDNDSIWKEHIKTSIVRTVIESVYPFVIREKKKVPQLGIKVVLVCPENEYHEIGLRMISDFFALNGYQPVFIGTNTPKDQVCIAISKTCPKYVAISVTDYYLLFEAQKMISKIKDNNKEIKIIVGGNAFKHNLSSISKIGGDIYLESFTDIANLREGDIKWGYLSP